MYASYFPLTTALLDPYHDIYAAYFLLTTAFKPW